MKTSTAWKRRNLHSEKYKKTTTRNPRVKWEGIYNIRKNSTARNLQEEINKVEYERRNDKDCVHMG